MALDVYVGSLTRYYMGDWASAGEAGTRDPGAPARIGRAQDSDRVREQVLGWREKLAASLAGTLDLRLTWDESANAPHFTGRPGWDGFGSLVLWAAYAEHPGLRRPGILPEEWDDDPALVRSNADGFRSRFAHLVRNVELWLPVVFDVTFEGEDVGGRRIVVGSSAMLVRQLAELNGATWKVKADEVAAWGRRSPPQDASLEMQARHAFAVMSDLAAKAVEHGLPIKLDF
jgi:hypothetical protein